MKAGKKYRVSKTTIDKLRASLEDPNVALVPVAARDLKALLDRYEQKPDEVAYGWADGDTVLEDVKVRSSALRYVLMKLCKLWEPCADRIRVEVYRKEVSCERR